MNILRAFARPMLATSFVLDGIDALTRPARHVERFEKVSPLLERAGLPPVLTADARMLTRACGAVSVAAGLGLATGRAPRTCAAVLAALNVPFTLINNPVWAVSGKEARKQALSGLARGGAVGAGLLLAAVDREGRPSLVWRSPHVRSAIRVLAAGPAPLGRPPRILTASSPLALPRPPVSSSEHRRLGRRSHVKVGPSRRRKRRTCA